MRKIALQFQLKIFNFIFPFLMSCHYGYFLTLYQTLKLKKKWAKSKIQSSIKSKFFFLYTKLESCYCLRGSIKKTRTMWYAPTLISLIYEISIHLKKRYICSPILKTSCFVNTAHGNVENMMLRIHTHSYKKYPILISR